MRCTGDNRSTPTNVRTFSAGALPSGFLTLVFLYLVDHGRQKQVITDPSRQQLIIYVRNEALGLAQDETRRNKV